MNQKKIYDGKILGLSIYTGEIEGRHVTREVVEHRGAAAILALEGDDIIMVSQHRFPHGYVLEIPAGTLEPGETPEQCATRELKEETGYTADRLTPLIAFYPSIGYNTEIIHCYTATNLKHVSNQHLDEDEILAVKKIKAKKVLDMIMSGEIQDSKTICAVLTHMCKSSYL